MRGEREARSLGSGIFGSQRSRFALDLTSLLPPLYTLTTQAITKLDNLQKGTNCPDSLVRLKIERDKISRGQPTAGSYVTASDSFLSLVAQT